MPSQQPIGFPNDIPLLSTSWQALCPMPWSFCCALHLLQAGSPSILVRWGPRPARSASAPATRAPSPGATQDLWQATATGMPLVPAATHRARRRVRSASPPAALARAGPGPSAAGQSTCQPVRLSRDGRDALMRVSGAPVYGLLADPVNGLHQAIEPVRVTDWALVRCKCLRAAPLCMGAHPFSSSLNEVSSFFL
jgi:hypothetical protein